MWKGQKISVIFSTYNERDSIRKEIEDYFKTGLVDEIIVVNNNAVYGTEEEVAKTKAKQVFEKRQGYGWGYRRGIYEASGDIIILSEPDGTFPANNIIKLLAYSENFDVVFGSRTHSATIMEGANMGWFLKIGNWAVAKLMEVLFNTVSLTDAGCTMKLYKRRAIDKIRHKFTVGTQHFGPELIILTALNKIKFIEIPIIFKGREGKAIGYTGNFLKAFKLGWIMIGFILKYRIKSLFS